MRRVLHDIENEVKTDILVIALAAFSLLAIASLVLADRVGLIGGFLHRVLLAFMGELGSWVLPFFLLLWCGASFIQRKPLQVTSRVIGMALFAWVIITLASLTVPVAPQDAYIVGWQTGQGGGLLGGLSVTFMYAVFGAVGMRIVMLAAFLAGLLLITRISLMELCRKLWQALRAVWRWIFVRGGRRKKGFFGADNAFVIKQAAVEEQEEAETANSSVKNVVVDSGSSLENEPEIATLEIYNDTDYILPDLNLLRGGGSRGIHNDRNIKVRARKLEETLNNFGIEAKVTEATVGPAITRYEIRTAPGVKVSRVTALADDIAMSLAATDVRIVAPIPGKAAIGIEVPNDDVSIVYLRDVLNELDYRNAEHPLTIALGKDISGKPVIHNLARMPHLLIAGATGSGKSVCINVIINSILFKASPSQVRFLMIDPKRVELSVYSGIPHLLAPVVTDPKKAAGALRWVVEEMEKRYTAFAAQGARDLERYNRLAIENDSLEAVPMIVVVIDELADLMMVASGDVEDAICRLAQMGRAAGIHLVIGTQRPSVDVITGLIKANIPARIAFAVSSGVDSRTILDINGAEKLLGKGDMLFNPPGVSKPIRVQGAYISEAEVERVVAFIKEQAEAEYEKEDFTQPAEQYSPDQDLDELFPQAVRIVVDHGQASVSLLQRRLRIGYTRAARIIDQMEAKGIVGGYEGSKPRQVFADNDYVRSLLSGEND